MIRARVTNKPLLNIVKRSIYNNVQDGVRFILELQRRKGVLKEREINLSE